MIDYEKIAQAHELCLNTNYLFIVEFGWDDSPYINYYEQLKGSRYHLGQFKSFDDLIAKLRELTKPEPKYKVNQLLWLQCDDIVRSFVVEKIYFDEGDCIYYGGEWDIYEKDLFPTRQALIEHQIGYWAKMERDNSPENWMPERYIEAYIDESDTQTTQSQVDVECQHDGSVSKAINNIGLDPFVGDKCRQHESDVLTYSKTLCTHRCIKCGEFYR